MLSDVQASECGRHSVSEVLGAPQSFSAPLWGRCPPAPLSAAPPDPGDLRDPPCSPEKEPVGWGCSRRRTLGRSLGLSVPRTQLRGDQTSGGSIREAWSQDTVPEA